MPPRRATCDRLRRPAVCNENWSILWVNAGRRGLSEIEPRPPSCGRRCPRRIRHPGIHDCERDAESLGSRSPLSRGRLCNRQDSGIWVSRACERLRRFGDDRSPEKVRDSQGAQDCISDRERRGRITGTQIFGNLSKIACRTRREPQFHRSNRRKAASTSSSVANSRRFACASPSNTATKWAGSTGSAELDPENETVG
jgi:hypothetical protein